MGQSPGRNNGAENMDAWLGEGWVWEEILRERNELGEKKRE